MWKIFSVFTVIPDNVRIVDQMKGPLSNGTRMEAADEGTKITLRCEAHGGRPIPSVSWLRNGRLLKGKFNIVFKDTKLIKEKLIIWNI